MTESFSQRFPTLDDQLRVIFNEDWVTEWGTPEEALQVGVERFWSPEDIRAIASEVRSLLREYSSDKALEHLTLCKFAIDPTEYGLTAREWWQSVRELLLEHVGDIRLRIYRYRGALYLPVGGRMEASHELDIEALDVVPEGCPTRLAEGLRRVVSRRQPRLNQPGVLRGRRPAVLRAIGVHSWSAFAREGQLWYIDLEKKRARVTPTKWIRESGFAPMDAICVEVGCPPDLGKLAQWVTEYIGSTRRT